MAEKKIKILLVDDDVETREMYAEVLAKAGYEIVQANDGVEGLDITTKEMPDLIFTGIVMPRMDGFTMMETLKKTVMTASIPVVISSHMGREEDQQRANVLGAKDFIMRNVTPPKEVVERINALFVRSGMQYTIDFNPYSMDAQKLARDLSFNTDFQCLECNEKTALSLKLVDTKNRIFEAEFICPRCGWVAK